MRQGTAIKHAITNGSKRKKKRRRKKNVVSREWAFVIKLSRLLASAECGEK